MYDHLSVLAAQNGMLILGALHPAQTSVQLLDTGTLVLFGTGSDFWSVLKDAPEGQDGQRDPVDRWSTRVLEGFARQTGSVAHFPFGGPPYKPFINWALASGRAFQSPAGPMVHDAVGMMISFRGALHFEEEFELPPAPLRNSPCETCPSQPCITACPVGALNASGQYDVPACYAHLDRPEGRDCMETGCRARLACPLSKKAGRDRHQTSHHMRYFRAP